MSPASIQSADAAILLLHMLRQSVRSYPVHACKLVPEEPRDPFSFPNLSFLVSPLDLSLFLYQAQAPTALHFAAKAGNIEATRAALASGIRVDTPAWPKSATPLHIACGYGKLYLPDALHPLLCT